MGGIITNNIFCQAANRTRNRVVNRNNPQNEQGNEFQEGQEAASQKKENGFNLFNCLFGFAKGIIKETINMVLFIPKLVFNLITNPVETIKGLIKGFSSLIHLILNPAELMKALNKAWENFCNADSEGKGKILGKIFANFVALPVIGNPLLLNARLISGFNRISTGITAIIKNKAYLSEFYKTCGSRWQTFQEARNLAKKANCEKDFQRALKLEGIPQELAPKLIFERLPKNMLGGYSASMHTLVINTRHRNIFLTVLDFIKGNTTGQIVRHEVKHAGQALHAASIGGKVPFITPPKRLINDIAISISRVKSVKEFNFLSAAERRYWYRLAKNEIKTNRDFYLFLPENIWNKAVSLKPKIKTSIPAKDIPAKFLEALFLQEGGCSFKVYRSHPIEREAFRAQARYIGLAPRFYSPSIHNIERLLLEEQEENRNPSIENENQTNLRDETQLNIAA